MHVYLAGPMTGLPDFNFPAFEHAQRTLEEQLGWEVWSPAARDLVNGFDPVLTWNLALGEPELIHKGAARAAMRRVGFNLRQAIADSLTFICSPRCTGLVILPGWQDSEGTILELRVVTAVNKPIWEFNPDNDSRPVTLIAQIRLPG